MQMLKPSVLDCGVLNYQKQRFVLDPTHLTNEIVYVLENTTKTSFDISAFSYRNVSNKSFLQIKEELDSTPIGKSFNFFINRKGNVVVDVEVLDKTYFYQEEKSNINIVFCLETKVETTNNTDNKQYAYDFQQLKTFKNCINTITNLGENTNLLELTVPNTIAIIQNLGFDINNMRG